MSDGYAINADLSDDWAVLWYFSPALLLFSRFFELGPQYSKVYIIDKMGPNTQAGTARADEKPPRPNRTK